jgi:hypothetical protein
MRSFSIRSLSALAMVASAMVSLHAHAQQQCSELLLQPDVKIDFSDIRSRSYFREVMCSLNKEEYVRKYGVQTGGNYLQTYSGMANANIDRYDTIRREQCSDRTSDDNKSALAYSSVAVVPQAARESYVQCLRGQEFVCDLAPGPDAPLIMVYYNPPGLRATRVRSINVINGTASGLAVREVVNQGTTPVYVSVRKLPFRFTLQLVQGGDVNKTCTAYLPAPPPPVAAPPPRFQWKAVRVDDCGGNDMFCTLPSAVPDDGKCDQALLGLTAVCWGNNENNNPHGGPLAQCSNKPSWCTYKRVRRVPARTAGVRGKCLRV